MPHHRLNRKRTVQRFANDLLAWDQLSAFEVVSGRRGNTKQHLLKLRRVPNAFFGLDMLVDVGITLKSRRVDLNRANLSNAECLEPAVMHRCQVPNPFGVDQAVRVDGVVWLDATVFEDI